MNDEYHMPAIKKASFDFSRFAVDQSKSERYGDIVKKTSQLLKRPYSQLHIIFTREKWSVEEIERAYQLATKHNGNCESSIAWWANRKRRCG